MKRKLMKKMLCMLLACVMVLGAHIPSLAEEAQETAPAWNFSVTYVEADSSFSEGVESTGWMEQMTIAGPQSAAENFLGWGSLPNGEVQYAPGAPITLMSQNRHAILYAIYGSTDDNLFEIVYHVGEHTRRELFRSDENTYTAAIAEAYAEGFKGWALTEGSQKADYMPGDVVSLTPSIRATDATQINKPSLELYAVLEDENTSYLFAVHYHTGGGVKTVEQESDSVVVYFTLEGRDGITGWSLTPGGEANFAPGAEICLQYNQPELTLYAAGVELEADPVPPADDEPISGDADETETADETPVWSSADESVAVVDQSGKVTAVGSGTTTITVTKGGATASVTITIESGCDLCGAQGVVHQVMDCGNHCEVQMTGKTHQLAACGFEGGVYDGVSYEGHYDCDGKTHYSTPISQYCNLPEGRQHTQCWPDIMHACETDRDHNPAKEGIQEGCGNRYSCWNANAHTLCRMCGDMWCSYDNGGHETACGNAYHRPCQINQTDYYRASDHQLCGYGCGKYVCNGDSHGTGKGQCSYVEIICSFCGAEGAQHDAADCGSHCVAQSGEHVKCDGETGCGGWRCDGKSHDGMNCDHCQQMDGDHTWCTYCESFICHTPNVSHGTGEGQCSYVPPVICSYCGTVGTQHDAADCGKHCVAQSGTHSKCDASSGGCGGWLCEGSHARLSCEHCPQVSGTHQACGHCGDWLCYTPNVSHGTGEGQCGYVAPKCSFCKQEGEQHSTAACGSHCVNQSGDHSQCGVCDTYYCNGWNHHGDCDHCYSSSVASDHAFCTVCEEGFLCWGSHGDGVCNAQ